MAKTRRDYYTIVVVGVGGTGGELVTTLAKYIYDKQTQANVYFDLAIIDGDRVEEKNCGRQPFISEDIGMFKVDALSMAISECLLDNGSNKAIDVLSYAEYIDDVKQFDEVVDASSRHMLFACKQPTMYDNRRHIIILGCVDNHRARQTLDAYFYSKEFDINSKTDLLYIDSANEFDFGTVVVGFKDCKGIQCPPRSFYFPEVLTSTEKKASELSCGALNISSPQHYKTNKMAANIIFSLLSNFIEYKEVFKGQVYFDTRYCEVKRKPLDMFISDLYNNANGSMAVARFTLAVDRRVKREETEQNADFISCVSFGKPAEFVEKYLHQGTKIAIVGRIQTGSYTNRDGVRVYTTDVVVESAEFAESKASSEGHSGATRPTPQEEPGDGFMSIPDGVDDEGLPFN